MAVRIQFRRGTAAEWASANPTLAAGELGYESDTGQFKIGNGSQNWNALSYGAVSESYVDNAIANVIDLSPSTLDTLNELAAAIGDDPDFINTINGTIDTHVDATTNVHGIANTAVLETQAGAQDKANSAISAAASYTDNAIANLVDSAPGALNTLNELAAALGDDENFSTTVTNSLATKLAFISNTSTNFTNANALSVLNTIYIETDSPGYIKYGDGVANYNDLEYVGASYTDQEVNDHSNETTNVHGISDAANLAYLTDISNVNSNVSSVANNLSDHENTTTSVHGIADTADLVVTAVLTNTVSNAVSDHNQLTLGVHGISNTAELLTTSDYDDLSNLIDDKLSTTDASNTYAPKLSPTFTGTVVLPGDTSIGDVSSTEITYLNGVSSALQTQIDAKLDSTDASNTYAPKASPTFTGTVVLPSDTSIGDVSSTELAYLNGVSSALQTQIDGKLDSGTASSTYAPIANASFTGTISLPTDTSIGDVSSTEIGYLNNVSSSIQTQLDAKAPTASPTFTGTVSGITASMVGLGDVDNTSDLDKPVSNAVQTALDLKANLANPTFTGEVETADLTVTGNLIVQGTTTTVSANDLKLRDNMIYLNQAGTATLTNAVGDGTNVVYTTSEAHGYQVSDFVTVANTTPSSFNISGDGLEIIAVTSNTFTVASNVTDTYTSGGTTRGKVHFNPDLGWAAGRYADNTYAHAGVFRDATDGVFKFFDGYVPEPDESVFIDTAHNTFALADVAVADLTAANLIATTGVVFPDNTIQTSAGVPSLTSFTEKTASYTLDTLDHQDNVVEMNSSSGVTFTIPTNANLAWPIGASMDILQTGTGQVTIAGAGGVTVNSTPGLKLRTQWSSCTIMKRGTDSWIVYGDLTA